MREFNEFKQDQGEAVAIWPSRGAQHGGDRKLCDAGGDTLPQRLEFTQADTGELGSVNKQYRVSIDELGLRFQLNQRA
jgi:hypothetical protein